MESRRGNRPIPVYNTNLLIVLSNMCHQDILIVTQVIARTDRRTNRQIDIRNFIHLMIFMHLQSAVCHYAIYFYHVFLRGIGHVIENRCPITFKQLNQFIAVAIEGEQSPYTASNWSLISPCDFPYKNKYRITDQHSFFHFF